MKSIAEHETILLSVLEGMFPATSKSKLRKMLTQGRVEVNEEIQFRAKHEIHPGDTVVILDHQKAMEQTPPPESKNKIELDVVFEDDFLLVVNKPAHLLSIATDKLEMDTLHSRCVDYLRQYNPDAWCFIVHRLDRETSGVMVFAKSKHSKNHLQEQFSEREVHRQYLALVEGTPQQLHGTINTWLMEDKFLNVKAVNSKHPKGKEAISHYRVINGNEDLALVEVEIETGRRHQIRMAMQYLETPVVGDELHGAETNPHRRLMLHAHALEFLHPEHDDPVRFEAPPPKSFNL